jgi:hypothetical protein
MPITYVPYTLTLQSETTLYQREVRCEILQNDFNYSMNPTVFSGSNGDVKDFVTGSAFKPYMTTIGLYNDSDELLVVGKFSTPVPITNYSDMTVLVRWDF